MGEEGGRPWRHIWVAVLGTFVGTCVMAVIGFIAGISYANRFMADAGLDALAPPLIGGAAGGWAGAVLGCWIALRVVRAPRAGATAAVLLVLLPLWTLVAFRTRLFDLATPVTSLFGGRASLLPIAAIVAGPPAAAARAVIRSGARRAAGGRV